MTARVASAGQVLVLFVLFLLVLLGVSAVGIDYATWLLTDRNLQNTADHAALAGASQFQDRTTATTCTGTKCYDARRQAWTSLNDELDLGLLPGDNLEALDNVPEPTTIVLMALGALGLVGYRHGVGERSCRTRARKTSCQK